jgi:FMN reductase
MSSRKPIIVGIGGTTRSGSSSEQALAIAMKHAEAAGAQTITFAGAELAKLPMYDPDPGTMTEAGKNLVEALRKADGVIVSSPCYHGGVSGLIKNAIDYIEEMRADPKVYLDSRSFGIIACGFGYQGPGPVLSQLRQTAHALRAWPTPLGVGVNSAVVKFTNGECSEPGIGKQIEIMAQQVVEFARHRIAAMG